MQLPTKMNEKKKKTALETGLTNSPSDGHSEALPNGMATTAKYIAHMDLHESFATPPAEHFTPARIAFSDA